MRCPVGSACRVGDWRHCSVGSELVSSPRHLEPSVPISSTRLSCPLPDQAYGTSPVSRAFDPGSYPKPTPRPSDLFRLPLAVPPDFGSCRLLGVLSGSLPPLPSWGTAWQQGSFAPRTLLPFSATASPSATVSPSATFPVSPVIGPTLLHRFRGGTRTASPVAWPALVTVLSLIPRRNVSSLQSACDVSCCLRPASAGSASAAKAFSRPPTGSLTLRPSDSLTILTMALSVGFIRFVSSTNATQATRSLTFTPVGLSPTDHASLRWTHTCSHSSRRCQCPA